MTTDTPRYVATGNGTCTHTRGCPTLHRATVREATPEERATYDPCPHCRPRDPPPDPAPPSIPCPCGDGDATKFPHPVSEPYSGDRAKRAVHHRYRHTGCPIGGVIVTVDGELHCREGPLFDPLRYGFDRVLA